MSGQLFVRSPAPGRQEADWLELDASGQTLSAGRLPWDEVLARLATPGAKRPLSLLLPVAQCLVTRVQVPAKQARQLDRVLPWLVEDQLAGSIDDMHVVAGRALDGEFRQAVVVESAALQSLLTALDADFEVQQVSVDALCLPAGDGARALFEPDQVLLALLDGSAQSLHPDDWSLLAPGLLGDTALSVWRSDAGLTAPDGADVQDVVSPLQALAAGLANAPDLLTGAFQKRSQAGEHWRFWRGAAGLLVAAGAVSWLVWAAGYVVKARQEASLRSEMLSAYQQVFPDEKAGVDPASKLERWQSKQGGGASGSFVHTLSQVVPVMQGQPGVQLKGLGFDASRAELRLDLSAADLGQLNQMQAAFQAAGLRAELGQSAGGEGGYNGRLTIKTQGL